MLGVLKEHRDAQQPKECSIPSGFFREDESAQRSLTIDVDGDEEEIFKIRKISVETDFEIAELCSFKMTDLFKFKRKQVTVGKQHIMTHQVKYQ